MKEQIQNYLTKIISVMALPIGVTIIVIFVFFIVFQTYMVFNISQIDPELLNASIAMVLVFITILYVSGTWQIVDESKKSREVTFQIVEETRKDRKVEYIERQLEKLYYPLKICLNKNPGIQLTTFDVEDVLNIKECLHKITPHLYLSSDKLRVNLNMFLEIIEIDFISILINYVKKAGHLKNKLKMFNLNDETEIMAKSIKELESDSQTFYDLIDKITEYKQSNANEVSHKEIAERHSELVILYQKIIKTIDEDVLMLENDLKELLH